MGPLPQYYRLVVVSLLVALCVATGIWLAGYLQLPLGGLGVGLGAGVLLAWLVTHDFTPRDRRAVRIQRRR
jgi:hypothetical protein